MLANMGVCERISPRLPAGRYDTFCRGVLQYALIVLKREKKHDCSEAKIENAVCRLEKFWNRLSCLLKEFNPFFISLMMNDIKNIIRTPVV
jgi:hypothetical protein